MVKKLFAGLDRTVEWVVIILFFFMVIVGGMQVFNRFALGTPLTWSEEVQKYAHIWIIFLTIPICYRRGRHIGMEIVTAKMPAVVRRFFTLLVDILWLVLGCAIAFYTWQLMQVASMQYSPALELRMDWVYLGEFLGGCYLALVALRIMGARLTGQLTASLVADEAMLHATAPDTTHAKPEGAPS